MPTSIFEKYEPKAYPYVFQGHAVVDLIAGGIPANPDVAKGWIKARAYKGAALKDSMIAAEVAGVMEELGVTEDQAIDRVAENRHLCGFKCDKEHGLYIEGRQLKACIKEAVSAAADVGKIKLRGYGVNGQKQIKSFSAEHIFVREDRIYLGADKPSDTIQSFVSTFRGTGIQYTEVVDTANLDFTVETDKNFPEEFWAMTWLTAQHEGIGAMRSQGYGRFTMTAWEPLEVKAAAKRNGRVAVAA